MNTNEVCSFVFIDTMECPRLLRNVCGYYGVSLNTMQFRCLVECRWMLWGGSGSSGGLVDAINGISYNGVLTDTVGHQ